MRATSPRQNATRPKTSTPARAASGKAGFDGRAAATADAGDGAEDVDGEGANDGARETVPTGEPREPREPREGPREGRTHTRFALAQRKQAEGVGPGSQR